MRTRSEAAKVKDPVCGMTIDPAGAAAKLEHEGRDVRFCSLSCRDRFAKDPAAYTEDAPKPKVPGSGPYTCPMHPEVRSDGPGDCPICGMDLEPVAVSRRTRPPPSSTTTASGSNGARC